ncbi:MAG: M1 family aminopeptidase [Phaeodactylibacter sp.]|uniref:M1 family metallopeptidase n=1 Tax=Phaeodactylibacter sp. TaxID=1940289 RepID=UPI0032EB6BD6
MSITRSFILGVALLLLGSCGSQQKAVQSGEEPVIETEFRQLDTMFVSAPRDPEPENYTLPVYRASHTRTHDLIHTVLDLRFNWEKEQVLGQAALTLSPYFYPSGEVTLDAKGFELESIRLKGATTDLDYEYDGQQVVIDLGRTYKKGEEYTLLIDYVATPAASGGSAAITSDKGLFFIDPRDEDPDKPTQIWTQGETEHNSRWFPTIDKPNERTTQEMFVTVDERYEVLSNGILESVQLKGGQKTWHWVMDQPHAPYLFMLAIGEFAVVEETWEGKPVTYYVEPEYKEDAKAIFAHTKEMLSFFSEKLGVKYPWQKYAQVVVRDYVSGAMENTTAVIFGDFVQRSKRELIDDGNDRIVAHELFHHWFGDLVTTESWANLTMNEGFANYSEYLWFEHKYGRDYADHHLLGEWSGYLSSAQGNLHPLIHFGFEDKEDMFDAHSYNKGGAVLHMLRNYVGDEAFFAALNLYLTDNAYTAVEAHNLRLAFEEVTGEDLNWFFNQWYFEQGHPELNVTYDFNEATGQANVMVEQVQNPEIMPAIFQLPAAIDIYKANGEKVRHEVMVSERVQTFTFELEEAPALMQFDADRVLLAEVEDNKTSEQYLFQYEHAPHFLDRYEAVLELRGEGSPAGQQVMTAALKDPFWAIRTAALQNLTPESAADASELLSGMASEDPHSEVRAMAFTMLGELGEEGALALAQKAIQQDSAFSVIGAALQYLTVIDPDAALEVAAALEDNSSDDILLAVGELYATTGETQYLPFFKKNLTKVDGFSAVYFVDAYKELAINSDLETAKGVAEDLSAIATGTGASAWIKFGATRGLNEMRKTFEQAEDDEELTFAKTLTEMLKKIKASETNPQLLSFYNQMLSDVKP